MMEKFWRWVVGIKILSIVSSQIFCKLKTIQKIIYFKNVFIGPTIKCNKICSSFMPRTFFISLVAEYILEL
jgi:hypothetical protein